MKIALLKYRLNKKEIHRFLSLWAIMTIILGGLLYHLHSLQVKQDRTTATAVGESIVGKVLTELGKCYDTTELLVDLYKINSKEFLDNFATVCKELHEDNLVIGSMYWAPDAIIQYAYPHEVDSATLHFEMLKDPIQGPKAQKALESRLATIAGPHNLIEGGNGFIIRNPYYDESGKFVGFAIMVIDTDLFLNKVMHSLQDAENDYRFSIWKTEDPTANYDEGGYILSSHEPIANRVVNLSFAAPNDEWHLTIEPKDGWTPIANMMNTFIFAFVIYIIALISLYTFLHWLQMREEMHKAEKERERMAEIESYQQKLMAALEETKAANLAKSTFFFNMSHDIRTPMNAIMGYTRLLQQHIDEKDKCLDYIEKMQMACDFLLGLVNDVLDMARIESGLVTIEEEPAHIGTSVDDIYELYGDMIKKKNLSVSNTVEVTDHNIYCDRLKIKQIYLNLISNSIKYTPEGGSISVVTKQIPCSREGYITIRTTVKDNGYGISKDYLPHIFDEYTREQSNANNVIRGTGLGLPIVKKLIELMGGTITVESEIGKGTAFIITTDHRIANEADVKKKIAKQISSKSFNGKRILLAEDNELNAEIACEILTSAGLKVDVAEDGLMCIEKLLTAAPGYYDVILMDILMPNLNGYDTTRRIRSLNDKRRSSIPIIALTANAFEEDKKNAIEAGMNGHLAKPIEVIKLFEALANVI